MLLYAIFLLEILALFFLSRRLTQGLLRLFYKLTKNKKGATYLYALFFAPGTFIHEVSHFLMALFLLVPVGQLEIIPAVQDEKIKLGSTPIAKTDPIRRTLIGFAPFLFGTGIILVSLNYLTLHNLLDNPYYLLLTAYFVFEIGNTMFLSKEDLEGAWKLLLLIIFLLGIFYLIGVRFSIDKNSSFIVGLIEIFKDADLFLLVPLGIDLIILAFLRLGKFQKLKRTSFE